jgi:sugar-specific transcriptional regulator TrmB
MYNAYKIVPPTIARHTFSQKTPSQKLSLKRKINIHRVVVNAFAKREKGEKYMSINEETSFLVKLGLTISEAKVYLILTQIGKSQIGPISKATGIHRPNLYQTLQSLKNKGIVEEEISTPTKYKAKPPQEVISTLIRSKQTQIFELKTKSKTIIKNLTKRAQSGTNNEYNEKKARFIVIPGKQVLTGSLKETLQKTQSSLEVITTQRGSL